MALESFGMAGLAGAMMGVGLLLFAAIYVYLAFVWMTIAKKLDYDKGWLAWIPLAQFALLPILAKKRENAWPWVFIILVPIVGGVFAIMWNWQIFERRNYPGWLSLIPILAIIPVVGYVATLANLVILGLVAWMDR
ncbi:hypothetical protein HOE37_03610 [Candidatus Woesearchaeota archaeon]|jgi:hypothetical protein|nr:hypothetical protein [Candidatus Woesearchaeota archaeon]MBT4110917.1 hypothetical protein [Candidatus Woesearchaeota archaeon]MBT4336571.1 hypothetical protein [Candidatus Woesearchaeota archaeon]MBT4469680.1 hypothetical protein [Candidatus Woesearchaeota archaeon]MBT6744042.1 hypothetical protein [Candidatus Woesearchaeota archaeon]